MNNSIKWLIAGLAAWLATAAYAQTNIQHTALAYYVPGKRIEIQAQVSDPKGIKLARTYFKVGPQADYLLVPMQSIGSGRYASVLPAPSPAADSIEYLLLAVNDAGQVSRTDAYKMAVRRSGDAPAWQNVRADGPMKVFTEVPQAQMPTASFTDSVTMDLVESGARFGAVAGLAGGGAGSGAAGGSSATATAAGGGLSTMAIIGGVALAGAAAAAAGGGGGGGGGGGSTSSSYQGSWSGTQTASMTFNCPSSPSSSGTCSVNIPFSGTVNSAGAFSGTGSSAGSVSCSNSLLGTFGQTLVPSGAFSYQLSATGTVTLPGSNVSQSGVSVNCSASTIQFSTSPRRINGTQSCSGSFSGPPSCNFSFTLNITGS